MTIVRKFWCAYGPQDARISVVDNWAELQDAAKRSGKKDRGVGSRPAAMTIDVGLSFRRGCRCHFNTFVNSSRPDALLLSWVEREHVDCKGQICHGLLCPDAASCNAQIAPRLSQECIQFVERLLRSRVTPAEIILEHQEQIAEVTRKSSRGEGLLWSRDMQLTSIDIRNVQARLRKDGQLYHQEDGQAIRQWTERHPEHVIYYQEQNRKKDKSFCLVFRTPWMLKNMAVYGQEGAVAMDATHERRTSRVVQEEIKKKIESSHQEFLGEKGEFKPSCFITDDCAAEKASIRVPNYLCIWHVRCAFNKNLMIQVHHPMHRAVMNKELAALMYTNSSDPLSVSDAFVDRWKSKEPLFVQYYQDQWVPKLKEWVIALTQI
ncbi:hypothetical protein R1sor_022304 [Riccia sorocarpa]|uniref:Transposase n=1 Tax=Riccia sorocarpa TaxID=122646 RepID=A0ABD3GJH4_9MARC